MDDDLSAPSFISPAAGTTVKLGCRSTGSPRPDVTWTKDGVERSPIEGLLAADGRDVLLLPEVTQSDSGRYACKVSNRAGAINRYYVVDVDSKENFFIYDGQFNDTICTYNTWLKAFSVLNMSWCLNVKRVLMMICCDVFDGRITSCFARTWQSELQFLNGISTPYIACGTSHWKQKDAF